jgi:hypothetical protein
MTQWRDAGPSTVHRPRARSRRQFLATTTAGAAASSILRASPSVIVPPLKLSSFKVDVTVPLGHGMMGGAWLSKSIADPLEAHGLVLSQGDLKVVLVSVDWCEIRNDAYSRWQKALAQAVDTRPEHVLITTVHQHDAPVADLQAEQILRERKLEGTLCDPEFHERTMERLLIAARISLRGARTITHVGTGKGRVDRVASNRRYVMPSGEVRFDRTSATQNTFAIQADEGLIDSELRTLSFWEQNEPVAAISFYAVHPMSYYGQGEVSADFPGLARRKRQSQTQGVHQIYCSGCSGNITAGKYNNGDRANRQILSDRLHAAMVLAWKNTRRQPVGRMECRVEPLHLEPRKDAGFSVPELQAQLAPSTKPFQQCLAAMGLSWRRRCDAELPLWIPLLDLGPAQVLLLPGESYIEFQIAAQKMRSDAFVCVAGYGDGAVGYIPTDRHITEKDSNLKDWCWIAPGAELRLLAAMKRVMKVG